ncbi:hypothetical protein GE21DRAFT_9263 [Neurospora crassa]|uniref:Uncharacterized protein n=2 Tax=Neurospora crassa TaxID=5141 RepID=Q7RZG7_NEUCR|nr:hypothetical protein NCU04049 [Neurospora crassa OR74A]EAA28428.1 hypothetical protein NCU04049 [Neurospora crassa OR74A]KHE81848.1 hypothetical protein GE21DRAFT_9263 [Neurospora crassa]CAE85620.1 hypothetical protein [Neurospora crassa]|eukprot:XP_957664.1 hypothetical protein NCU04049 [Neurospora crassa OR74A]
MPEVDDDGFYHWFPWGKNINPGWSFDVITLLAIIGEGSVAEFAQTITASSLCMLPRLIPAPQALLRPQRPQRLPEVHAKLAAVYGGTLLDSVGFFANILHPLDEYKAFDFRVFEIKHTHLLQPDVSRRLEKEGFLGTVFGLRWLKRKKEKKAEDRNSEITFNNTRENGINGGNHETNTPASAKTDADADAARSQHGTNKHVTIDVDPEQGDHVPTVGINRRPTMSERITDIVTAPKMMTPQRVASSPNARYTVPPALDSPMHVINVFSFLLTVTILIITAYWNDGAAVTAIVTISLAATVMGYASWWYPLLMARQANAKVPPGDVVIRTREGAFLVVKCTEEVARELYQGTEECRYVSTKFHRLFMGIAMVLLMVAVVLLGNCRWSSQALIGGAYVLLNSIYWVCGLLPQRFFWDLSRYTFTDITPADVMSHDPNDEPPNFTRTLWYAIRETKKDAWVDRSGALPGTLQWKKWLEEALKAAKEGNYSWDAVGRKDEIMRENPDAYVSREQSYPVRQHQSGHWPNDPAAQKAPLDQVQPSPYQHPGGTL